MSAGGKLKITVYILGVAGLALFIALLVREGFSDVFVVVAAAGLGVPLSVVFHAVPLAVDGMSWRVLFPKKERPSLWTLTWMRWMGESVNNLVPAAQTGGDVLRARLAVVFGGVRVPVSAASVISTVTLNVFAQIIFTLAGFALLINETRETGLAKPAIAGSLLSCAAIGGFFAVQRFGGIGWLAKMIARFAGKSLGSFVENAGALEIELNNIYSRVRDVILCCAWATISWVVGAVEIWIAMRFLGMDTDFDDAFIFESISQGFRTAAFFIPGALGVQEGGYMFVAKLIGVPGQMAMALAMIRRVREIVFGVPGIIAWQILEGKRLRRNAQEAAAQRVTAG